jgi:hypothetical protein
MVFAPPVVTFGIDRTHLGTKAPPFVGARIKGPLRIIEIVTAVVIPNRLRGLDCLKPVSAAQAVVCSPSGAVGENSVEKN